MSLKNYFFLAAAVLFISASVYAQKGFSTDPLQTVFETGDTKRFWQAFDSMPASSGNPFTEYVNEGSPGVKGFILYRIINADSLYITVKNNQEKYLKSRNVLTGIGAKAKRTKSIYAAMKYWYPKATFPPVYFVYGRLTSGGTVPGDGIIIGTEMLKDLDGITALIAHELIHFQQDVKGNNSLLKQSLVEGGADFIGELISGENIYSDKYRYGDAHAEQLYREFVSRLKDEKLEDWLYGTSKKDDRPNDLGYWIGYKITEAYFNRQNDKHKAVNDILHMKDPLVFLRESGFLDSYIQDYTHSGSNIFDDFFKEYSDETYPVQITVKVPKPDDEVYITGNQPELGSWNPSMVKMHRKKLTREPSTSGSTFLPNLSLPVVAGAWRQR